MSDNMVGSTKKPLITSNYFIQSSNILKFDKRNSLILENSELIKSQRRNRKNPTINQSKTKFNNKFFFEELVKNQLKKSSNKIDKKKKTSNNFELLFVHLKKDAEEIDCSINENLPFKKNQITKLSNNLTSNCFKSPKNAETKPKFYTHEITVQSEHQSQNKSSDNSMHLIDLKLNKNNITYLGNKIINDENQKENNEDLILSRISSFELRKLLKFKNINDSEEDRTDYSDLNLKIFYNKKKVKSFYWDTFIILGIIYSISLMPVFLAFKISQISLDFFELFIDILFFCEIFLQFVNPFIDEEENIIISKSKISEKYLKSYFWLDLVTNIPITFFYLTKIISNKSRFFFILKWVKVFRIFKLEHYLKTSPISKVLRSKNVKLKRIFNIILILLFLIHISTSGWIFLSYRGPGPNWISSLNLSNSDFLDIYIASYYFQLVTIYTIGYGDIVCINNFERIFTICLLIIGVIAFSLAISILSDYFGEQNKETKILNEKILGLKELSEQFSLSKKLYLKVRQTLISQFLKNQNEIITFLENLPKKEKQELMQIIYKNEIKELKFFNGKSHDFILNVLPLLRIMNVAKNDILISIGEFVNEIYLVNQGCISLNFNYNNMEIELVKIQKYCHFGENFLFHNIQSPFSLKGKSKLSKVFILNKNDFFKLKNSFEDIMIEILKSGLNFLDMVYKKKIFMTHFCEIEENVELVQKKINSLNRYFFNIGFNDYYNKEIDFEDPIDFVLKNDSLPLDEFLSLIEKSNLNGILDKKTDQLDKNYNKINIMQKNLEPLNNFEKNKRDTYIDFKGSDEIKPLNSIGDLDKIQIPEKIHEIIPSPKKMSEDILNNKFEKGNILNDKCLDVLRTPINKKIVTQTIKNKGIFYSLEDIDKCFSKKSTVSKEKKEKFKKKQQIIERINNAIAPTAKKLRNEESSLLEKTLNLMNNDRKYFNTKAETRKYSKMSDNYKILASVKENKITSPTIFTDRKRIFSCFQKTITNSQNLILEKTINFQILKSPLNLCNNCKASICEKVDLNSKNKENIIHFNIYNTTNTIEYKNYYSNRCKLGELDMIKKNDDKLTLIIDKIKGGK